MIMIIEYSAEMDALEESIEYKRSFWKSPYEYESEY